jgi:RimJ/RimL family protein N-acetyltransferase
MTELQTERLLLREWRDEDIEPMIAINRDPEVTQFLNRPSDEQAALAFHERMLDHWTRFGFGLFAAEGRAGALRGELLGFVGLSYPEFLPQLAARCELGWRLSRASWGLGLATEAALACRDDAFARLGLPELISIIHPGNLRSQRVAQKVGMAPEGTVFNAVLGIDTEVWQRTAG